MDNLEYEEITDLERQKELLILYKNGGLELKDDVMWFHEPKFSLLIKKDDIIIGASSCYNLDNEIWILDAIVIKEEYSGQGYGLFLLDKIMEIIRNKNGKKVFIIAKVPKFFEKYGFLNIKRKEAPDFSECFSCQEYMKSCFPETMVYILK